jgi:homoserine acetyltransferase
MRTNGYRSPAKMRQILDYISNKFYEKLTLAQYLEKTKKIGHYHLKNHAMLQKMTDFSTIKTPLAVIFCLYCQ